MTLYHSTGIIAASGGAAAKPGMVLLKPTSIAHSGTSASIGANGQVTFTAVTSLSLNGVFSAAYDNYVVSWRGNSTTTNMLLRMRSSGTDDTGSNYVSQYLIASGASVGASREGPSGSITFFASSSSNPNGATLNVYGPFLAQPTAFRSITSSNSSSAYIEDRANTHSLSTSYDGFTIIPSSSGNMTGALQVYGVKS